MWSQDWTTPTASLAGPRDGREDEIQITSQACRSSRRQCEEWRRQCEKRGGGNARSEGERMFLLEHKPQPLIYHMLACVAFLPRFLSAFPCQAFTDCSRFPALGFRRLLPLSRARHLGSRQAPCCAVSRFHGAYTTLSVYTQRVGTPSD